MRAAWRLALEASETVRPDMADGNGAYRHYHEGKGKRRRFSYDRYVRNDKHGAQTLRNAILEAQGAANKLWQASGRKASFSFTGPGIRCGSKDPNLARIYPYPSSENWQKAIGAHWIWLTGDVTVDVDPQGKRPPNFTMQLTLHAEDRYNFNPNDHDITTGLADKLNGRFVVVGLAHEYTSYSSLTRRVAWSGSAAGLSATPHQGPRSRQPTDNRRPSNRL